MQGGSADDSPASNPAVIADEDEAFGIGGVTPDDLAVFDVRTVGLNQQTPRLFLIGYRRQDGADQFARFVEKEELIPAAARTCQEGGESCAMSDNELRCVALPCWIGMGGQYTDLF